MSETITRHITDDTLMLEYNHKTGVFCLGDPATLLAFDISKKDMMEFIKSVLKDDSDYELDHGQRNPQHE